LILEDGTMKSILNPYTGIVYTLPNYIINDPLFKKETKEKEVIEKQIKVYLVNVTKDIKHSIKISNKSKGIELKQRFFDHSKYKENEYKIRLLFGGFEIKDDEYLFTYNLESGSIIQISILNINS
jgi:hypothetical protein